MKRKRRTLRGCHMYTGNVVTFGSSNGISFSPSESRRDEQISTAQNGFNRYHSVFNIGSWVYKRASVPVPVPNLYTRHKRPRNVVMGSLYYALRHNVLSFNLYIYLKNCTRPLYACTVYTCVVYRRRVSTSTCVCVVPITGQQPPSLPLAVAREMCHLSDCCVRASRKHAAAAH